MHSESNEGYLVFHKNKGKFYYLYGDDAYIINYLFNYKKIVDEKVGFPDSAMNKVQSVIEENKISYKIIEVGKDIIVKDYKTFNKYDYYLKLSKEKLSLNKRLDRIINKLSKLKITQLDELIKVIEDYLDE